MIKTALLVLTAALTGVAHVAGHPESKGFHDFPVAENLPWFRPLDISGSRVSLWNRKYELSPIGLLQASRIMGG